MSTLCPCSPQLNDLSSTLPIEGPFDFSFLTTLTQPLAELCKSIEGCRNPCHNYSLDTPLVNLSDALLCLCHAACTAYGLLDDELGPAASATTHLGSLLTCTKSPMALGKLTLQAEEETLLARQVVYAVLTNLSALLRDAYTRGKEAAGVELDLGVAASMRPGLYGREGDGPVSQYLSKVLALLGRLFPE